MNQIERLLRRAVAAPRGAGRDGFEGFDPFEQTAAWPVDATNPVSVLRSPSSVGGAPADVRAAKRTPTVRADDAPEAHVVSIEPATMAEPVPAGRAQSHSIAPSPSRPAPTMAAPLPAGSHGSAPVLAPLAQADAFMRALRTGTAPADPAQPDIRAHASNPTPDAVVPAARTIADERSATTPIRPVAPAASPASDESVTRSSRTAKPALTALPREPARSAPEPTRATPERVIETTVVVASSGSHRLDELAHGSRIARFGIGQG